MRITLKNFRCHTDSTFEIPDQGLIALSGENGAGKSTVFAAISYALYGKIPGKVKKPYTQGKTTSSVELEYLGLEIVRHAAPKRLLVTMEGEIYEGDPAQSIINEKMGMTYEEYLCVAHVIQRSNTSILSMTASKQIEFIQTLANSSADKYKEEVKLKIKQTNAEMLGVQGELKALHAQKEEKESLYPEVPVAPKEIKAGINPTKVREIIKKLEADTKTKQKELDQARNDLEERRNTEKQKANAESKIKKLEIELAQLQEMHAELSKTNKPSKKLVAEIDESIATLKVSSEHYRKYVSYLKEKHALDNALVELHDNQLSKMQALESQIVSEEVLKNMEKEIKEAEIEKEEYDVRKAKNDLELSRKEEARKKLVELFRTIRKNINVPKEVKTAQKMISALRTVQKEMIEEIGALKKQGRKRFCCPGCSAVVFLTEDETQLEVMEDTSEDVLAEGVERDDFTINAIQASTLIISEYIKTIEQLSKDLNIKVEDLGEPARNPMDLHKALLKATRLRAEYDALESGELPPVIERMQKSVEKLAKDFEEETSSSEEAQAHISQLEEERDIKTSVREGMVSVMEKMAEYQKDITSKQKLITKLKSELPTTKEKTSVEKMEKNVALLTQKISDLNLEIGAQRKILDNVADYEHYQNTLLEISVVCQKIADVEDRHTALERKMEGLYGLEQLMREAEILALEETVESINECARIYLDQIFSDPILVRLECVKYKDKVAKLQINTVIEYQGNTYTDADDLSGGERQRCDVAFLLATNNMYSSKLLILDECLNELDSNVNSDVLTLMRDLCGDSKLILIVCHEGIRGIFDEEVFISH